MILPFKLKHITLSHGILTNYTKYSFCRTISIIPRKNSKFADKYRTLYPIVGSLVRYRVSSELKTEGEQYNRLSPCIKTYGVSM